MVTTSTDWSTLTSIPAHVAQLILDGDNNTDTLGGLVFTLAGRVPVRGELVAHPDSGAEFEVLEADPRRIKRLRLRNMPPARGDLA